MTWEQLHMLLPILGTSDQSTHVGISSYKSALSSLTTIQQLIVQKSFEDRVSRSCDNSLVLASDAALVFGGWQVHWWNGRVIWRPPEVYWEMIGQEQVHRRLPSHPRSSGWRRCTGVSPSKSSGVLVVWDIRLTSNPIDILEGHIKLWGTLTPWASR